jgi:membrane-bound inhibitor of C-type lysozyme
MEKEKLMKFIETEGESVTIPKNIFNEFIDKGKTPKEAIIELCKMLDKPFIDEEYTNVINNKKGQDLTCDDVGVFFKHVHMMQWRRRGICRYEHSIFKEENTITNEDKKEIDNTKTYSNEWKGDYTEEDVKYLDDYLKGLYKDFKIVTTNHKDYAKKIAQASLAVDKAYQAMLNGESGAGKKYKDLQSIFDTMSKSAQFSENTRNTNDVSLGCFGVVFSKVEQKKWIPRHTPLEKDDYDKIIEAFSTIKKSV